MGRENQETVFQDWLSRHKGLIIKVVRSYASTEESQDDLFQEITLQIWKSIPNFTGEVAESTWIYRVSFYTAISWIRKESTQRKRKKELMGSAQLLIREKEAGDPRLEWLYEQINLLDPIDRSLVLLLLDGFSYQEMAETLGMTESNVGVKINRIKKRLVEILKRENQNES